MRLPALACAGILALAGLTACGSDDDPGKVTSEDLGPAVLTVEDLSDEFQVDPETDSGEDGGMDLGCLDLSELKKGPGDLGRNNDDTDDENGAQFEASEDPGMPAVFHAVKAFPSQARAEQLLDKVAEILEDCHEIESIEEGTTWQLDVELDRSAWARGADEQLNVIATGTSSTDEFQLPVNMSMSLVRIENAVSMLMFLDFAEDTVGAPRKLTSATAARLQAIFDGEDVPDPEPLLEDYPIGASFADLLDPDNPA